MQWVLGGEHCGLECCELLLRRRGWVGWGLNGRGGGFEKDRPSDEVSEKPRSDQDPF